MFLEDEYMSAFAPLISMQVFAASLWISILMRRTNPRHTKRRDTNELPVVKYGAGQHSMRVVHYHGIIYMVRTLQVCL